ncbi:MAG: hypothetical protein WAP98_02065 [Caldicoprobacterales bacterium]|jgi:hypothetical protein|nr:hypothetical protein [Clostridia bacterium]MDI9512582.1 hypothetical protein [Bacillota bacterium]NLH57841.1 hypothetical protein [Clostridiales bacterium]
MLTLLLAVGALFLSYLINKILLGLLRERAIIFAAPLIEELAKTIPAYTLNRPILLVHFFFGVGEAIYDLVNSSEETGKWAGLVSILSHLFFAAIVYLSLAFSGSIYLAISLAILAHVLFNYIIMKGS